MHPGNISIKDFTYELPEHRIALHPLEQRDDSKLMVSKGAEITEDHYRNLASFLPAHSLLLFNNTRVINARIFFKKETGGVIEIFLLEPVKADYSQALAATGQGFWKCLIGGASKWKEKLITTTDGSIKLQAQLVEKLSDAWVIQFLWSPSVSFAEVLEKMGKVPLPPYIKRKVEADDTNRYQTVYAKHDGSVAAPTAGLHFTQSLMDSIHGKGIETEYVTLHVGAGTFKPVKAERMAGHEMHAEWIEVSTKSIKRIMEYKGGALVAVGTTSMRTLESLYWLGRKAAAYPDLDNLTLNQWEIYEDPVLQEDMSSDEALTALLNWLEKKKRNSLFTTTQLLIAPGYQFRLGNGLITNFHQPQSTLLLLVAAVTGGNWRLIYDYALQHDFRFLSYGDGSLLWVQDQTEAKR